MSFTMTTIRAGMLSALAFISVGVSAQDALPPKEPGVVRVGIIKPKVQTSVGDAAQVADAVRNTFAEYLSGPTQQVVLLTARAASQAMEEAQLAECDFVLSTTVVHKRGGSGGGLFGQALNQVAGTAAAVYAPAGNYVASAAVDAALRTATDYAVMVEARDELRVEYTLQSSATKAAVLQKKHKARAEADGQDILTPLVETAAESIAEKVHASTQ